MRKKFLLTTIIILMLSCCFATSFAVVNNVADVSVDSRSYTMNTVSPSAMYMPLVMPKLVAVTDKATSVVCDNEIAVYSNGDYIKIPTNNVEGFSPKSVAMVGENLLIIYENIIEQTAYLKLWNIATQTEIILDSAELLGNGNEALRIDEDKSSFYIHSTANELIEMTLKDGVVTSKKYQVSTTIMSRSTAFDIEDGQIYIYNNNAICSVQNGVIKPILARAGVTRFKILTDGVMYVVDDKIHYYTAKSDIDLLPYTTQNANSCYWYGENIYYCDSINNQVKILDIDSAVVDSGIYYGDKGNAVGRYSSPADIAASEGYIYVADTNNNRISFFNTETNAVAVVGLDNVKPLKIAANGDNIAIYDGNSISIYKLAANRLSLVGNFVTAQLGKIISMVYHYDKIIALTDSGTVYQVNQELIKIYENPLSKQIIANSNSNYIYVLTDKLVKVNMKTYEEDYIYSIDSTNLSNIVIDYAGSVYGLTINGKNLQKFSRENNEYTLTATYDMDRISANAHQAMDMKSGDIYIIDTDMHKLARLDGGGIGAVSLNDVGYTHTPSSQWSVVEAGAILADTKIYIAPNNDEAVEDITAGQIFLVLCYVDYNGERYAFGTIKGQENKLYYVQSLQLDMCEKVNYADNHPTMTAVFPSGAVIREFPMRSAKVLTTAKRPIELKLINNVAGEYNNQVWQWFKVTCKSEDGAIVSGYVEKDDVYYTSAITPPKKRVFLKVQTEGLGKTVQLFKEPNAEAEVIADNIGDGEKVVLGEETFNTSSEFTKVVFNNTVGYIYTACLLQSGLTASQVTTIVVSVLCVVIFIVLVVLLALRKKLFNKSTRKTSNKD